MKKTFIPITMILLTFLTVNIQAKSISYSDLFNGKTEKITKKNGWTYKLQVRNKGSRSEGQYGYINYKGKSFPNYFYAIICPLGEYKYFLNKHHWGAHKWMFSSKTTPEQIKCDKAKIQTNSLKQGYYKGSSKKAGTPKIWVRVYTGKIYYWVNPKQVSVLIKQKKLKYLSSGLFRSFR